VEISGLVEKERANQKRVLPAVVHIGILLYSTLKCQRQQRNVGRNEGDSLRVNIAITLAALLFASGFSLPVTYLHELGHAIVCSSYGFDYYFNVSIASGSLVCQGDPEPILYHAAGGSFAAFLVSIGALVLFRLQRTWIVQGALIATLAIIAGQLLNAMLETLANNWYLNSGVMAYGIITGATSIIFIVFVYVLAREQYVVKARI
jgi:hypothetical protein